MKIKLPDGSIMESPKGPSVKKIAEKIGSGLAKAALAGMVDDELVDLDYKLEKDSNVKIITYKNPKGKEVFNHSASHAMALAIKKVFPKTLFTIGPAIENGFYYDIKLDKNLTPEDLKEVQKELDKIIKQDLPFNKEKLSKKEALIFYKKNKFKQEIIKEQKGDLSFYSLGSFKDLCKGPHVPSTTYLKAVKVMKSSAAYWRGDASKDALQRVYGIAFPDKKDLKNYLKMLEEAEKRDHRKIGKEMGLFSFHEEAPGMPFWQPKGMALWNELMDFWREEHRKAGYHEIKTPLMLNKKLWVKSGHWKNYRESMYTLKIDKQDYAIKPMNCPGCMLWYGEKTHSYKELPLRVGEVGLVHRHELSGVLSGLFRARCFHQDDAHIFMTPDQIKTEILGVLKLVDKFYKTFGFDYTLELSTRPKKSIGTAKQWETTTKRLKEALDSTGKDYKVNEGEGAFYGPKIDVHVKDALGRYWQCATIQLDMSLPERFDLNYIGKDNSKHRPIMIHRVIYGSLERFIGILVEHYAGKFPLWLSPTQIKVLSVSDKHDDHAQKIADQLSKKFRVETDFESKTVQYKIRQAQIERVPYTILIGDKEVNKKTLAVRTLAGKVGFGVKLKDFIKKLEKEVHEKA
ncbi:MAG: threonine--tRNA ligase [Nanoarchaeota archaeon]|nr:threonine--tRNA ligase [Nanoarchaeota archaeon]